MPFSPRLPPVETATTANRQSQGECLQQASPPRQTAKDEATRTQTRSLHSGPCLLCDTPVHVVNTIVLDHRCDLEVIVRICNGDTSLQHPHPKASEHMRQVLASTWLVLVTIPLLVVMEQPLRMRFGPLSFAAFRLACWLPSTRRTSTSRAAIIKICLRSGRSGY